MGDESVPVKSRRIRWAVVVAVVALVAVLGAGFLFAAQFQSSAQREANTKAPAPGPVFAEVLQGSLAREVGFTGHVGPSTQSAVTVLPVADASLTVVTGRPLATGGTVSSGQVLTEANGRPLFGVYSAFPFYRDMGVGDRGPDVAALQAALAAQSSPVNTDGRFGRETAAAVTRWYEDNGYVAPTRTAASAEKTTTPADAETKSDTSAAGTGTTPVAQSYVPVSELVAIPGAAAQVVQGTQVGQRLADEGRPDLILGSADLVVSVTAPATDLGDVLAGDEATITLDGFEVAGTVGEITSTGATQSAEASGSEDQQQQQAAPEVSFTVTPATVLPVPTGRARVTVVKQIVAEDALIVPVLAVADRGPDKNVLTKQQDDGSLIEVPVTVLGTLQGEVAVAPITEGAVKTGDRVRVG